MCWSCTQEEIVLRHCHVSGSLLLDTVNSPKGILSEKTVAVTELLAFVWVVDFSGTPKGQACLHNVISCVAHSYLVWDLCVLVNLDWAVVSEFNANNILWPAVILYFLHCNYGFLYLFLFWGQDLTMLLNLAPKSWSSCLRLPIVEPLCHPAALGFRRPSFEKASHVAQAGLELSLH